MHHINFVISEFMKSAVCVCVWGGGGGGGLSNIKLVLQGIEQPPFDSQFTL